MTLLANFNINIFFSEYSAHCSFFFLIYIQSHIIIVYNFLCCMDIFNNYVISILKMYICIYKLRDWNK